MKETILPHNRADFYYSRDARWSPLIGGILIILAGLFILLFSKRANYITGIPFILLGCLWLITGIRSYRDKELKLSIVYQEGIWTRKLGWVPWDALDKAEVVADRKHSEGKSEYLHLYLKSGHGFGKQLPDDRVSLDELEDAFIIETLINAHFTYRRQ